MAHKNKITREVIENKKLLRSSEFKKFLGKDNSDIEFELFGHLALDFPVTSDMETAVPVGSPSLSKTRLMSSILKTSKGIYSILN